MFLDNCLTYVSTLLLSSRNTSLKFLSVYLSPNFLKMLKDTSSKLLFSKIYTSHIVSPFWGNSKMMTIFRRELSSFFMVCCREILNLLLWILSVNCLLLNKGIREGLGFASSINYWVSFTTSQKKYALSSIWTPSLPAYTDCP